MNHLDSDDTPQNFGPHLGSKLFDTQIKYWQNFWMDFLHFSKDKKMEKNELSMQSLNILNVHFVLLATSILIKWKSKVYCCYSLDDK